MTIYKKIFFSFLLLIGCGHLFAQSLSVTATSSSDGKKITVTSNLIDQSATWKSYSVVISSAFGTYTYSGAVVNANSSPGVMYTINVTATYSHGDPQTYTISTGTTLLTDNPQPPPGPPERPNPCALKLPNGLTFEDFHSDGSPRADGEIIISWSPLLNDYGLYKFRYRVSGTSTWSYSGTPSTAGYVYNGNRYADWAIGGLDQGGVEYEIQVAYVCALPSNLSDYSSSYFTYTLF